MGKPAKTAIKDAGTIDTRRVRRLILRHSRRANVGHIGSCLCVVEILAALYGVVLRSSPDCRRDRDRFVLSKGHAALALYSTLVVKGLLPESALESFCGENSLLAVHPEAAVPGVDFSTGSLGHGLSIAVGAALAASLQSSGRRTWRLISDAECNEGSVWEAAMFAAHQRLAVAVSAPSEGVSGSEKDRWRKHGLDCASVVSAALEALGKPLS
jgi:transketolase